jgi:hypothetical protein
MLAARESYSLWMRRILVRRLSDKLPAAWQALLKKVVTRIINIETSLSEEYIMGAPMIVVRRLKDKAL